MIPKILSIILLILSYPFLLIAGDLVILSSKTYNSGGTDIAYGVVTDSEDNIIVSGESNNNYFTIKYDKYLEVISSITYNGSITDTAYGVATDSRDNIIVTGVSNNNYFTIKYSSYLSVISSKTYDSGGTDIAHSVVTDTEGNIIVTGISDNKDYFTIKYSSYFVVLSSKTYDDSGGKDEAQCVTTDSEDNIIVTGYTTGIGSNKNWHTIKYDKDLNVLSSKTYDSGGLADKAYGVATDSEDNIIVTGFINPTSTNNDYFLIKYNKNLAVISSTTYNSGNNDIAYCAAINSKDDIFISGYITKSNTDSFSIFYNKSLLIRSSATYNSGNDDKAQGAAVDKEDNVIICGESNADFLVIKYKDKTYPIKINSISEGTIGKSNNIEISGEGFYGQISIAFDEALISAKNITIVTPAKLNLEVTIPANTLIGKKNVTVTNINDNLSGTGVDIFNVVQVEEIPAAISKKISANTEAGALEIEILPSAFPKIFNLKISMPDSIPDITDNSMKITDIVVQLQADPALEPQKDITMQVLYKPDDIAELNENKLGIIYYNGLSSKWETLLSNSYPEDNKVITQVKKLGIFAAAEITAADNELIVYPNPYKPTSGGDYDNPPVGEGIMFAYLPEDFDLKVFNIVGEFIFDHSEKNSSGFYLWNTECNNGKLAPSGIYFYYIKNTGSSGKDEKGKFSIIR